MDSIPCFLFFFEPFSGASPQPRQGQNIVHFNDNQSIHTLVRGTSVGKTIPSNANNDFSSSVITVVRFERLVSLAGTSFDITE